MTTDYTSTKADLEKDLERVKRQMGDRFYSDREDWDQLINRERGTVIQPELAANQRGIDYRTAVLEKALFDVADTLTMNPTRIHAKSMEGGERNKKWARDRNLWHARCWNIENEGRWWDRAAGMDQARYGVSIMRLCYYPQKEPEYKDEGAEGYIEKREKAMRANRKSPFHWKYVPVLATAWMEREGDADVFFYEYELSLLEANSQLSKKNGNRPTIDGVGKIGWLGAEDVPDRGHWDEKVKVIVRDARDIKNRKCPVEGCDHYLRTITEYICLKGGEPEEIESYDSPFPGCSFFIISGRQSNAADPNRRYRPMLYPLYTEAAWHNYLTTLLATLVREDYGDEDIYLDTSTAPTHIQLPEPGPDGRIVIAKAKKGEILAVPGELKRWPKEISPHLQELIEQSENRMREFTPDRFNLLDSEVVSESTGTAYTSAGQQASLPFDWLLSQTDAAILKGVRYKDHAIQFWDVGSPSPVKYYVSTSGDEAVMQGKVQEGEMIFISAEKIAADVEYKLKTQNMTAADEAQKWMIAKDKHMSGAILDDELYEAAGQVDLETFKKEKRKQQLRAQIEPQMLQAKVMVINRVLSVKTGIPFSPMPMGQPGLEQPQQGAASPQQLTGRAINPPAIGGPEGGAGGVQ